MSDFDKFFAERLNEETEFPLREKNWKALTQRLDAVGVGGTATAVATLSYWKAAVLGLALTTGVLVWKVVELQKENARQREKIEQQTTLPEKAPVASNDAPEEDGLFVPRRDEQQATQTNRHESHSILPENASQTIPGYSKSQHENANRWKLSARSSSRTAAQSPDRNVSPDSKLIPVPAPAGLPVPSGELPKQAHQQETVESGTTENNNAPVTENAMAAVSELAPLPQPGVSPLTIPKPEIARPAVVPPPPITRPYREKAGRFRAGIQGMAAIPNPLPSGVSALKGVGATVEYSPLRNVWLSLSADWLSYQVSGSKYLPPQFFHEPQPMPAKQPLPGPNPPKPQPYPLVQVQGHQRIQFYNLGVRYALPVRFPIRPSVQLMHTWARFSPELYVFEFEDDKPGGPNPHPPKQKFTLSSSASEQTISNLWRIGFGLEHETRDWVFRAGVDWVENSAASKPVFDAALVQGSVLYKF